MFIRLLLTFTVTMNCITEIHGIRNLLILWTAWPILQEDLKVTCAQRGNSIQIRTCFSEIIIPVELTKEIILRQLRMSMEYALYGFGSV